MHTTADALRAALAEIRTAAELAVLRAQLAAARATVARARVRRLAVAAMGPAVTPAPRPALLEAPVTWPVEVPVPFGPDDDAPLWETQPMAAAPESDNVDPMAAWDTGRGDRGVQPRAVRPHRRCGARPGPGALTCARCEDLDAYDAFRAWQESESEQHDDDAYRRFIPSYAQWRQAKSRGTGWAMTAPGAHRAWGAAPLGTAMAWDAA